MNLIDVSFEDWGMIDYEIAWKKQHSLFDEALKHKDNNLPVINRIIFCEHPHVITLGKHANHQNVLFSNKKLREQGIALFQTDRGGDVTYHGPGQLVVYLILNLSDFGFGLKHYILMLETIVITDRKSVV